MQIPKIKIKFKSLWSLTETEQVALDQQKAAIQKTRAETAQLYAGIGAIGASEIRESLAESNEFNVETMLDDYTEEELAKNAPSDNTEAESTQGDEGSELPAPVEEENKAEKVSSTLKSEAISAKIVIVKTQSMELAYLLLIKEKYYVAFVPAKVLLVAPEGI